MVAWEANASLISYTSMSSTLRPAFFKASGIANAGPTPMYAGSTPTTAKLRMRASTGRPSFVATERRAIKTMAAPSDTWLALPAVVLPPALKAALSSPKPLVVVSARGPSSALTTTSLTLPSASFTFAVIGTISASKRPAFWAATARRCDSAAILSCVSREMPYFAATFSEVMPIGMRHEPAISLSKMPPDILLKSTPSVIAYIDMDSTPPAMPTSMMPDLMAEAMFATACRPLLHWRFTVTRGTS
mmetsp:Transcript_70736/g.216814  ORF Transcript_70736/g.216814 Transcript_70736/m.216814 type:complete len:246 (+) Transcript_70736:210-947(+)